MAVPACTVDAPSGQDAEVRDRIVTPSEQGLTFAYLERDDHDRDPEMRLYLTGVAIVHGGHADISEDRMDALAASAIELWAELEGTEMGNPSDLAAQFMLSVESSIPTELAERAQAHLDSRRDQVLFEVTAPGGDVRDLIPFSRAGVIAEPDLVAPSCDSLNLGAEEVDLAWLIDLGALAELFPSRTESCFTAITRELKQDVVTNASAVVRTLPPDAADVLPQVVALQTLGFVSDDDAEDFKGEVRQWLSSVSNVGTHPEATAIAGLLSAPMEFSFAPPTGYAEDLENLVDPSKERVVMATHAAGVIMMKDLYEAVGWSPQFQSDVQKLNLNTPHNPADHVLHAIYGDVRDVDEGADHQTALGLGYFAWFAALDALEEGLSCATVGALDLEDSFFGVTQARDVIATRCPETFEWDSRTVWVELDDLVTSWPTETVLTHAIRAKFQCMLGVPRSTVPRSVVREIDIGRFEQAWAWSVIERQDCDAE